MAELAPGAFFQARTDHSAKLMRNAISSLIGAKSTGPFTYLHGVRYTDGNDLKVTQDTGSNMQVKISPGNAYVAGTESDPTGQGAYSYETDGTQTATVATAHGSLARKDAAILQAEDAFYSGSQNRVRFTIVSGTAGSGVLPVLPENSLLLAEINVAANDTGISNAEIVDKRTEWLTGLGGRLFVNTTADLPTAVPNGTEAWIIDIGEVRERRSGSWVRPGAQRLGWTGTSTYSWSSIVTVTVGSSAPGWVEVEDFGGFGSTATTGTPVTIPAGLGGLYAVAAFSNITPAGIYRAFHGILINGTPKARGSFGTQTETHDTCADPCMRLAAGDTIGVEAFQNVAGAKSITTELRVYRIGN